MNSRVEAAVPNAAAAAEAVEVAIEALQQIASDAEPAPQKKSRAKPVRRAYTDTPICGLSPRSFYRACASHGATAAQIRDAISRRTGVAVEMADVRHEVWCVEKSRKPVPEHDAAAVLEFLGLEAVAAG